MHLRLIGCLDNQNLFYARQFGFCRRHPTGHALISISEIACGVDLQKTFDAEIFYSIS